MAPFESIQTLLSLSNARRGIKAETKGCSGGGEGKEAAPKMGAGPDGISSGSESWRRCPRGCLPLKCGETQRGGLPLPLLPRPPPLASGTEAVWASPSNSASRGELLQGFQSLRTRGLWRSAAALSCPPLGPRVPARPVVLCWVSVPGFCAGEPPGPAFLGSPSPGVNTSCCHLGVPTRWRGTAARVQPSHPEPGHPKASSRPKSSLETPPGATKFSGGW